MDTEIVTEEQCKKILSEYIQEQDDIDNKDDTKLTSFLISPLSNQLDGLIGEQFFLTLRYQTGDLEESVRFFVKIVSKANPIMYEIAKEICAFEKEVFFYDTFIPYLREEGFKCDYLAKSYLWESDVIVLKDLTSLSYTGSEKNKPLDLQHCKLCLRTIAKFHTDTILFELCRSKDLDWEYKLSEAFPEMFEDTILVGTNTLVLKYFEYTIKGLSLLINTMPEDTVKSTEFNQSFITTLSNIPSLTETFEKKYKLTICHNDLWCNNFLYKYSETREPLDCMIIDFQTFSLKPPIYDALGFLYLNTRKSFRDQHLIDLLRYYYKCFSDYIEEHGYNVTDILSEEEFKESYDSLKVIIKLHSLLDRSFTLIPEEIYAENSKTEEDFSRFMFEDRGKIMLDLFQSNDTYKEIITEELCEVRSMLFKH